MTGVVRVTAGVLLWGLLLRRAAVAQPFDERAELLLDLPVGVLFLLDDGDRVVYASRAAERFLGYAPKDVVGRPITQVFAPESRDAIRQMIDRHAPGDPIVSGEFRGMRRDGSPIPLQVVVQSAVVSGMSGHKVTGLYLRDFAERGRLVDALATRGAALARSNRELEQFAYIASHDLQEPLRMVGSYTQLLEQRYGAQLDDDAREFLRYAREGANRMRELIDALLSYSRIDSRAQPSRPVSMDRVLDLALTNLRASVEAAKATVDRGPLPEVDGDAVQLGQVVQNLIGNAIKFRGPNPPHISIRAERRGPVWQFAVHDDGIGILPEYQDRIFIIFQRLHSREEYPGTGIGLAVCKKVVERHGGRLWVESAGVPGQGSTFYFTVPVERAPPKPAELVEPTPAERQVKVEAMSLIEERLRELV
jgi:two-component system, chemotaxis family, sensor kinase Cph1